MKIETRLAELQQPISTLDQIGTRSAFTCPECNGTPWEIKEGDWFGFRCRTGHAFSVASLEEEQTDNIENSLWIAVRTLEEKVSLLQRLTAESRYSTLAFEKRLKEAETAAATLRQLLVKEKQGRRSGQK